MVTPTVLARSRALPLLLLVLAAPLVGCFPGGGFSLLDPAEVGRVIEKETPHGTYFQYVPMSARAPWQVVLLVHGSPFSDPSGKADARFLLDQWRRTAEVYGTVLVAPAFDNRNFGSQTGPGGGYRALLGRTIDADAFVDEILADYRTILPSYDGRIFLYGFSAGGQFAARYCILHPDRVNRAVIAAAGTYPWPDATVAWPNGMAPTVLSTDWGDGRRNREVAVSERDFVTAGQLRIAVVVGENDTAAIAGVIGNIGATRFQRGRNWVDAMNAHTAANRRAGRITFVPVPNAGHSNAPLNAASVAALLGP